MAESVPLHAGAALLLDRKGSSTRHVLDGRPGQAGTFLADELADGCATSLAGWRTMARATPKLRSPSPGGPRYKHVVFKDVVECHRAQA